MTKRLSHTRKTDVGLYYEDSSASDIHPFLLPSFLIAWGVVFILFLVIGIACGNECTLQISPRIFLVKQSLSLDEQYRFVDSYYY